MLISVTAESVYVEAAKAICFGGLDLGSPVLWKEMEWTGCQLLDRDIIQ